MDILITILVTVPLAIFMTLLMVACGTMNRENEAYMEGYNIGYAQGRRDSMKEGKHDGTEQWVDKTT